MRVLITGVAGFIGCHVALQLLARGDTVIGLDNLNDYYDPKLKRARLEMLNNHHGFSFFYQDLSDKDALIGLFGNQKITRVINLAAQAGVRYSLEAPDAYLNSNLIGFHHLLEACRQFNVEHLVYASSGSVSGLNQMLPSSVHHPVGHPMGSVVLVGQKR